MQSKVLASESSVRDRVEAGHSGESMFLTQFISRAILFLALDISEAKAINTSRMNARMLGCGR